MRVLLLGAGGFIGRHILAELLRHGHEVIAIVRGADGLEAAFPQVQVIVADLAGMTNAADWTPHLFGIDLVVNAAGILRGREMEAIHADMPRALHAACGTCGISRVILISAVSARAEVETDYAQSKLKGEDDLRQTGVAWTILRPSLVYGDGSYGGTSLMRGMAGLPWRIPLPGIGNFSFSPIHARDLARTVKLVGEQDRFIRTTLAPAGPDTLSLRQLLEHYRAWLGFGQARFVCVPMPVMRVLGRLGDLLGTGPISTNSLTQMIAGNAADGVAFARAVGFQPRHLGDALRDRPAQVQDRWHARLFFLAPALKITLIWMWLASAYLGLAYGEPQTLALLARLGLSADWSNPLRIGTSFADLAIAILLLFDRRTRWATATQFGMVLIYTLVLSVALPQLWRDPLGPLLKNLPILLAILAYGAIGDRR
jgi:uncharacterized protein YbjT (DUF2867 family)